MQIITVEEQVKGVAKRWHETYREQIHGRRDDPPLVVGKSKKQIYDELLALPESATDADVTAIIGNGSWTRLKCSECDESVRIVVMVGNEPDIESYTAYLCLDCIASLTKLVDSIPE